MKLLTIYRYLLCALVFNKHQTTTIIIWRENSRQIQGWTVGLKK